MTQDERAYPDIVVDIIDKAGQVRFIFLRGGCLREAGAINENALLAAAQDFFDRYQQCPEKILSLIGSKAKKVS
jgi:hypothetical protein